MRYRDKQEIGRRGVAAAELALWLPFLALMFAAALDFCRVYHVTQVVQNCALVGAMYASGTATANSDKTSGEDPAVLAAVAEGTTLRPPLDGKNVAVTSPGGMSQVSVSYTFVPLLPWPGVGGSVTITRTVVMTKMPTPGT